MFLVRDSSFGAFQAVVLEDQKAGSRATLIPARGAIVTSFFAHGREQLYLDEATLHDPRQNVRGGIPVLFPSPGKLELDSYSVAGQRFSMKQHGIARTTAFRELARGKADSAWVDLELTDSESSRSHFPFSFRLGLSFMLVRSTLSIRATIENRGEQPMPFALGYHPYFAVPVAQKAASRIPTPATRAWDNVARSFIEPGKIDLAAGEVDLHLVDHNSPAASLELPSGAIDLRGQFARWIVWTLPGKDFVCLEPWTAPANALNTGEGLIHLEPGASRTIDLMISSRS